MKIIFLFLSIALICPISNLYAQKAKDKNPYEEVLDSMAAYKFEAAIEILEEDIAKRTKRKKSTEEAESLLTTAHRYLGKMMATERLTIIDSIIVDKKDAIKHIHLSSESGSLQSMSQALNKPDTTDCTMFKNQMNNQMLFAQKGQNGKLTLYQSILIGNEWTKPTPLKGLADEDVIADCNYPFMLSDGATLYYAANDEESLGGYDIYMTRFDADEQTFLAPENIGMPFNSSANDYLFAIDEYYNLGWFVTDRNMPERRVCIYTFIPNETRQIYNEAEVGMENLSKLAYIHSIQDTWQDKDLVKQSLDKLKTLQLNEKSAGAGKQFEFVLNDKKTCYTENDFKNTEARKLVKGWMELSAELKKTKEQLNILRDKYADATDGQKQQMSVQIRLLESKFEKLLVDTENAENTIRKAEKD